MSGKEPLFPIIVKPIEPQGWEVGLELRQYYPTWFSAELPDDEFLKYIAQEIRQSKVINDVRYTKAVRNTTLDHPLNRLRSPYRDPREQLTENEQRGTN